MDPSVLLRNLWKPQFLDPQEEQARTLNLRALVDARRAQAIQREASIEDLGRKRSLVELLQRNPSATREDILRTDPFGGMAIIKEQDAQEKERRLAEEAQRRAQETQQKIETANRVTHANRAAALLAIKDPVKRKAQFDLDTPAMVQLGLLTAKQAADVEGLDDDETLRGIMRRGFGHESTIDIENKIAKELRDQAEEERKKADAQLKLEKHGPEMTVLRGQAEQATNKALGIRDPSAEEQTFRNVFLPGYLKTKGLPATDENVFKAYSEFQTARRPRIEVPGVDVPLSPPVAKQRVEMAQETADARAAAALANAAQKPATEGERKTLGFYERMKNAEESLGTLEDTLSKLDTMGQIRLKNAPDWAQTKEGQLYHQALRQFTEARLRKESGAVIGPSEFAYSEKTFFPQPLDDPATIKRKKQAREQLLNSMRREAGKAYTQTYGEGEPTTPTTGAADVVQWERGPDGKPRRKQ